MQVVVYLDGDKLDLKYFDEIRNLEKGLISAGHNVIKFDYHSLKNTNVRWSEIGADAYILTPGGIAAKEKFIQHLNLKHNHCHSNPVILYDFDEDFTSINQHMMQWCLDNDVTPGKIHNWWMVVTSVNEVVNLLM